MFVSKHVVFLEKEFLLRKDSGSKVNLGEVQDPLIDASHLTEPEAVIHEDELEADPSEAQALRRTSRICTFLERYGFFLINEQNNVLLIEDHEPIAYEESLNSLEYEKWFIAMKSEMDSIHVYKLRMDFS